MTFQSLRKSFNLFKFYTKLYLAGTYFTLFEKTYKVEGLDLIIPFHLTDIKFRGQFPINFYEKQERRYLKQFLPKNATVLELGACLGVVSCITNRLLEHPERQVVVEANPNVIPIIEENKARNHCKFNIEHCIVSSQPVNTFFIGKNILTSSNLRKSAEQITVTGKTVAQLEQQYGLTFDVLIMDIEGGELGFLRENREKLEQFNVVFMEIHPHPEILSAEDVAECLAIMEAAGLQKVVDEANFWVMVRPKTV
ncbi:MAG TPA: FkbM family methyltransferase [Saprospiraceae bacterium]|nr:FkbM family methyltransferase [Saprospiraceae bacterium]